MRSCKHCSDPVSWDSRAVRGKKGLGICNGFTHIQFQLSSPRSACETFTRQCLKQGVYHPASSWPYHIRRASKEGESHTSNAGSHLNSSMWAVGFNLMSWEALLDSWLQSCPTQADVSHLQRRTYECNILIRKRSEFIVHLERLERRVSFLTLALICGFNATRSRRISR